MSDAERLSVVEGYDRWSEVYDTDGNPLFLLEGPVVRAWFGDPAGLVVADVGCGTGRHTDWLVRAGAKVVAVDASEGMLERARARVGAHPGAVLCRHALPARLPLYDGACDAVLCALVGEHLTDLDAAFAEFARVLRPGGMMVFTALHPAMNLRGLTARFFDPTTGGEVRVEAFEYTMSDYLMPMIRAGLVPEEIVERAADEETARVAPRAGKYLGWPMLMAVRGKAKGLK